MSSTARIERLENWLHDMAEIKTENFSVSVEFGSATAEFFELDQYVVDGSPLDDGAVSWEKLVEHFAMQDTYSLSVVIRNQLLKDLIMLKVKLLLWLSKESQDARIDYDFARNNQDTYDYFFTLKISEPTSNSNDCDELKTC